MRDLLPEFVFNSIRDRYLAGIADAEALFDLHSADEDVVSGALGQALAMKAPVFFQTVHGLISVNISYRKIRGRGPNAPERIYGADGLFQISIKDQADRTIRSKGLPFQSKMRWRGKNKDLFDQASMMQHHFNGGLVIDYSESGYKACTAKAAIEALGSRPAVNQTNGMHPLGQILGNDFLNCTIGIKGLFFDPQEEYFGIEEIGKGGHIITTEIIEIGDPDLTCR